MNQIMRETMASLNIKHITTSLYHPQSNTKVERFHRFLGDILSKLTESDRHNWDLYLTQALAAVRFSKFYMLFGRDVILPVDNLLKPRRKYMGEDHHRLIIEQQHKTFVRARDRISRAQKKRNYAINKDRRKVEIDVGDPVYYRAHNRQGKLDQKWRLYYRMVEKTSLITFIIWNQLAGKVKRVHANNLKLAELREWENPQVENNGRSIRQSTLAVPHSELDSDIQDSELESPPSSIAEDDLDPRVGFYPPRQELHRCISEDEIPLAELKFMLAKSPEEEGTDDEEDMLLSKIQARLRKENLPQEGGAKFRTEEIDAGAPPSQGSNLLLYIPRRWLLL